MISLYRPANLEHLFVDTVHKKEGLSSKNLGGSRNAKIALRDITSTMEVISSDAILIGNRTEVKKLCSIAFMLGRQI